MLRGLLPSGLLALACLAGPSCSAPEPEPLSLVAVTFNTGSSGVGAVDPADNGGYGPVQAAYTDEHYGNGLAWRGIVEDTRRFFEALQPDVVAFQEIFHSEDCPAIPEEARVGFVCESWRPGDPTVAQVLLGEGYQIACHLEKPDKCLAVRRAFGRIRGCDSALCLDGLDGARVPDCGGGSRIGRGVIELEAREGETLTVVNVHGSSGLAPSDGECRSKQFAQVFEDLGLGDGEPAANDSRNLVLGDFNTDPYRLAGGDPSADYLRMHAGSSQPFRFHSPAGEDATPTYGGILNIDHVLSDAFDGSCWVAGVTDGKPKVTERRFFDHRPAVCELVERMVQPQ